MCDFPLCPLAVTRDLVSSLVQEFLIKCQVLPMLVLKSCYLSSEILFLHESVHGMIFNSYSVTPNELIFEL